MSERRKVFVYVPGLGGTEKGWQPLVDKLRADLGGEWKAIEHGCGPFSRNAPEKVARSISAKLDHICRDSKEGLELTLIGHSVGGLLLRTAYLMAAGQFGRSESRYDWPSNVRRIVLMASMDRGVNPEGSWRARLGTPLARLLRPFGVRFVHDILKGSTFVTNLRISWMRYYRGLQNPPDIVQVLGTNDDEVNRVDCLDPDLFPHAKAIDVPDANHVQLHDLTSTPHPNVHYERLRQAIGEPFSRTGSPQQIAEKKRVFLLLHGIRAGSKDWPSKLKEEILRRDPDAIVETPDYGYFSARRFAIPYLHRGPLRWFQDQYSQALAEHPSAEFYFVGHSNGTYLMAQSLQEIWGMNFRRIFLGGCVLSPKFRWPKRPEPYLVHNAFAHTDWVVAILCSVLAGLGRKDVGPAGFQGFAQLPGEETLVDSGHGAAFDTPEDLAMVADFIVAGRPLLGIRQEPPIWRRRLSRLSMAIGWLILATLVAVPFLPFLDGRLATALLIDAGIVVCLLLFLEFL